MSEFLKSVSLEVNHQQRRGQFILTWSGNGNREEVRSFHSQAEYENAHNYVNTMSGTDFGEPPFHVNLSQR